jgi:hypothetical protein
MKVRGTESDGHCMEKDTHSGHPGVAPPGFQLRAKKLNWNIYERSPRRAEHFGEQLTGYYFATYGWSATAAVLDENGECHDPALTRSSGTGYSLAEALEWLDRQYDQFLHGALQPNAVPKKRSEAPPYQPRSAAEVREKLHTEQFWQTLRGDALLSFLGNALVLYGAEPKHDDVEALGRLYRHAVENTEAEKRAQLMSGLSRMPPNSGVSFYVFLPSIVCDPVDGIASTACIDFVSTSPAEPNGQPRALSELENLYRMNSIANPGAVFGALIDLGDARFRRCIEQIKSSRTEAELNAAARIFSGYAKHGAITFWLDWAEQLINHSGSGLFGTVASALAIIGSRCYEDLVTDTERDFPNGIRVLRKWSKKEYAQLIAPRLYALEQQEIPPKTFSKVLECWGLTPNAAKEDQF